MAKEIKKTKLNGGFTLLEVMIAMTVFSFFYVAYYVAQNQNVASSVIIREEIKLKELCTKKINEIIVKPPQFKESLTLTAEVTTFEEDKNYEARVTYKRLKIPDIKKIMGKEEEDDEGSNSDSGTSGIEQTFMNKIKENMQEMIWQVEVQVVNKETKANYTLSTWLQNTEAQVKDLGSF